ncbi:MAG: alpha/beta fold hydrolase [Anaerolineae bacterium]|jgi:pimeloyl-ACP methyl ester carboxylesterase|nr:alpha/beta fold hydrolase [Anaerolineae bacterium]
MSAVVLDDSLVHYEALGRGRPLLFLHGWLGSWRYWVPTMIEFSSSHRAYALDFWGFGDSDKAASRYSIPAYIDQVAGFLDYLGIDRVPIVGHGLGGVVGLSLALAQPERVDQVLAVSVPLTSASIGRALSGFGGGENPAKAILGRRLKSYEEVDIEAAKTDGDAVVESVRSAADLDIPALLRGLTLPVLVVAGQDDVIVLPPDESAVPDLSANVHSIVFDGVQHYPMLEQPNKFARLLRDFFTYRADWDRMQLKDEWKRRMR